MHINLAVSYLPQKFFVNAPKKKDLGIKDSSQKRCENNAGADVESF